MQNGRFRVCKGYLIDSDAGKNKGYYDHNENYILTLSMPGAKKISLKFGSFCTEVDEDILSIFDGKDTNSTLIGRYHGSNSPGTISSTDSFITLHFVSDKSVSCTGWKAQIINDIIPPKAARLSIKNSINCYDSTLDIRLDTKIHCDSFNTNNTSVSGMTIKSIKSITCSDSLSDNFRIQFSSPLNSNGTYTISHVHGYRDYCDSIYTLSSSLSFSVRNCPIFAEINGSSDTICLGECINLNTNATGGNTSKYSYKWSHTSQNIAKTSICPKSSGMVIVEISDGNAIPGIDTFKYVVLSPPSTQNDTQLCYYASPVELSASPKGGKWLGRGIENTATGQFNPRKAWGTSNIVYQIGGCTDTMVVFVSRPYNYENVFCQDKTRTQPLYWYGPAGGYWTGNNVDSSGRYLADSVGEFYPTYHWQGCTSNKKVIVLDKPSVPKFDTTCESTTRDTLSFSPKGLIVGYFKGRVNAYWGWYNPSNMGGPGNYNVYFYGRGAGCRDTTQITVLPCYAGKDDTICPSETKHLLTGFRSSKLYAWSGKGISNPNSNSYSASWTNGQDAVDTVILSSNGCRDEKIIRVIGTRITDKDTVEVCPELDSFPLNKIQTNVSMGTWSGLNVTNNYFLPNIAGTGVNKVTYTQNGCSDDAYIRVLDSAQVPSDTSICEDSAPIVLIPLEQGVFYGQGVSSTSPQLFNPRVRNSNIESIGFMSSKGCKNQFNISVDTVPTIDFAAVPTLLCNKDSLFVFDITPKGGQYMYKSQFSNGINPKSMGAGNHLISYQIKQATCLSKDSFTINILKPLQVIVDPFIDSLCPGESTTLNGFGFGGTGQYGFSWSHGQSGQKAFASPKTSSNYILTLSDGCSDPAVAQSTLIVHPEMWFNAEVSDSVCYGLNGYIILHLRDREPMIAQWNYPGNIKNDTFFAPSGSSYTAFVLDSISGCYSDTTLHIPGYKALNAAFNISPPSSGLCYTPLDKDISIFDGSDGGISGNWLLNDSVILPYIPYQSWNLSLSGEKEQYQLRLKISNKGGCTDTSTKYLCFKDTVISFLPTAFTPDGDGMNDHWEPVIYGATQVFTAIYNRWGEVVFKSNLDTPLWDGKYLGRDVPEGLYVAYLELKGRKTAKRKQAVNIFLSRQKK